MKGFVCAAVAMMAVPLTYGVTRVAVPDNPLPDLADLRKRIPEIFMDAPASFRRVWFAKRLEAAERLAAHPQRTVLMQAELDEFRISFRDALAHWAHDPLNPAVKPVELDVADFGAKGDGMTDNIPAFDAAVHAVRALGGKPCVLKVGAGDYLFGAAGKDWSKRASNLNFTSVTNCVLAGAGPEKTRFLFGVYEAQGIHFGRSVNSTVQDVDCRWVEAPFSQTVVEYYDASNGTAIVRWQPGTLRPDDPRYKRAKNTQVCCVFKADGTKSLDHGNSPFYDLHADDLGGGRFRIYFDTKRPGIKTLRLTPGMYVILPDRDNRFQGASGAGAEYFSFQRVWYRNARSGAINCGNTHYSSAWQCRTIPAGDGIIFSSNADTFYNARGSFLGYCEFHHMCDDGANSLGYGKEIFAQEGPRTLLIREIQGRLRAGDTVQVLDAMQGRFRATLKVERREDFKLPNGAPRIRLTFTENLPTGIVTVADTGVMDAKSRYAISHGLGKVKHAADLLYAPLQFGTGFVCLGNRIGNLRGCGINVQCPHSIVEDNIVENVSLAFKMTGLTQWFEGTPPYDVVIRNNTFRNCEIGVQTYFCDVNGKPAPEREIRLIDFVSNRFENVTRPWALLTMPEAMLDGRPLTVGGGRADGMIPFIAITGRPTEAEVRAKVAAIQAQGFESFLIYARSGLEYDYMGEDWLKVNEWFCHEASRRSMKVWLYDEYNWPSGTCKGRVPQENDAWRYRELGVFPDGKGGFRWAEAYAPAGWVNVCEPAAVDRFIQLTHTVYEKRLARWFADGTIRGIFTDEPGHPTRVVFSEGNPLVSFRDYSGLEAEYRAETGRELRADVERFLRDPKADDVWPTYASLMGRRFRSAYFDRLRAWCDKMGVLLTGHLIAETDLIGSVRYNGLPLHCLRGESLPGMDEIFTAYDPSGKVTRPIEWNTYNIVRQAVLHRGNGGLVELFACGPADLTPDVLRQGVWMAAAHGVDHYIACMDVMDEKGLVEKHGYFAPAGPVHPWYAEHARVLVDDARTAALFARKRVSEAEVAVRYPNRLAARAAFSKAMVRPSLDPLLKELSLNQLTVRFVGEDEQTDLPRVFGISPDGRYSEERSGRHGLTSAQARALCDDLPRTFLVRERDGTSARDVLVRTYADGSSLVINFRLSEERVLVAERAGKASTFRLSPHGVKTFPSGVLPPPECLSVSVGALTNVLWRLSFDRPNLKRVNFSTNRVGRMMCGGAVDGVRLVTRECAMSYATTDSGRPIGPNEAAPKGERVLRHEAEPYAFSMDGQLLPPGSVCEELPSVFAPLYRTVAPQTLAVGEHVFRIERGEADQNYFLPALFLTGDFEVEAGRVVPRSNRTVGFGALSAAGFPHYIGRATWRAEVTAPKAAGLKLRLDTARRVTAVRFCGKDLGVKAWGPFEWEIPLELQGQTGPLEISCWTSAQPMFGDVNAGVWDVPFWLNVNASNAPTGLYAADWSAGAF